MRKIQPSLSLPLLQLLLTLVSVLEHRDVAALVEVSQDVGAADDVGAVADDEAAVAAGNQLQLVVADDDALNVARRGDDRRRSVDGDQRLVDDVLDQLVVGAGLRDVVVVVGVAAGLVVQVEVPLTTERLFALLALESVPVDIQVIWKRESIKLNQMMPRLKPKQ